MRPTAFTGRLGVQHPLVLAPMAGGPSTPALCAAVSEAGGLGSHGGAYLPPAKLRDDIRAIRAATSRPFAINLFADDGAAGDERTLRSEEHTSELQSPCNLVCRLLLEKKKKNKIEQI